MWVRGLKLHRTEKFLVHRVAPYVGAWIETTVLLSPTSVPLVAPYVGAWIETRLEGAGNYEYKSHPMWVRGLKHVLNNDVGWIHKVAPYVGAWIETKKIPLKAA